MTGCATLWGDSIGKGVIYNEARKRYCLARQRCTVLLEAEGLSIDSHARMGATIGEGFAEFQDTIVPAGSIAVIEYGGNDCDLDWDAVSADPEEAEEIKWVSYEELAEDLRTVPERYTVWFRIAAPEVLSQLNAGRDQHIHRKEGEG